MLVRTYQVTKEHTRNGPQGKLYKYVRTYGVAVLVCDCCGKEFERRIRTMDPRRLSPDHIHVCPACPREKFAQKCGVESRKFWNTTADKDINL